jgi:hypothetical protein
LLDQTKDAEDLITTWAPMPRTLRPRRQSAWEPSISDDDDDDGDAWSLSSDDDDARPF